MLSRFLSRVVDANPDINWRIITLTREPFSRAISALFQGIERRHPEMIDRNAGVLIDKAVAHVPARTEPVAESLPGYLQLALRLTFL